jgi:hypothetical protein
LRDGEKEQNECNERRESPAEELARYRLQQYDRSPAAVLMQKVDRFLAK